MKNGDTIDKIVAVVGDEFILLSDVEGQILNLKEQNKSINTNEKELRKRVLNALINDKLVVAKAKEDSVEVSEDEINQRWSYHLKNMVQVLGSEKRVEEYYGMSLSRIQFEWRDVIRDAILSEKMQQQKVQSIKASNKDVEDFYKDYKDSIPEISASVEIYHIVMKVQASQKTKENTLELAKRVRDSLIHGGNFADFAKRYSGDPGSASSGGDLGWVEKDKLFPEFVKAAFETIPGSISQPVETPFGYHLILVRDKRKDSVQCSHILFRASQSAKEVDDVKAKLLELKHRAEKGESFESLAKQYSEEDETKGFGGFIGKIEITKLPENLKDVIEKLPVRGISDPIQYNSDPTKEAYHIIYKKSLIPAHTPALATDYKEIEQRATYYKQMKFYQDWLQTLRNEIYWEIKDDSFK